MLLRKRPVNCKKLELFKRAANRNFQFYTVLTRVEIYLNFNQK